MNCDTRQIKYWAELTEAEQKSGKWKRLEDGIAELVGAANVFPSVTFEEKIMDGKDTTFSKKLKIRRETV